MDILDLQELLQTARHEIGLLGRSVVDIIVDHSTHEYSVDSHGEYIKKDLADEVRTNDDHNDRHEVIVERRREFGERIDGQIVAEEEEREKSDKSRD